MKSKTASIIKFLIVIAVLAAIVAAIFIYKNEILDAIDVAREKVYTLKRRYINGREFEDYEDDIL
ncbi:MAG: hypothetical protein IKQ73_03950 [Oscillospiraceae bacterium]|nr:hypothetical protein [Oscillospiraceae bacterium]MCR5174220.1 hypothetical protein [Oscillospiraceae bacterium]